MESEAATCVDNSSREEIATTEIVADSPMVVVVAVAVAAAAAATTEEEARVTPTALAVIVIVTETALAPETETTAEEEEAMIVATAEEETVKIVHETRANVSHFRKETATEATLAASSTYLSNLL